MSRESSCFVPTPGTKIVSRLCTSCGTLSGTILVLIPSVQLAGLKTLSAWPAVHNSSHGSVYSHYAEIAQWQWKTTLLKRNWTCGENAAIQGCLSVFFLSLTTDVWCCDLPLWWQDGCTKVYISTSDVQMHANFHRKDSAIIQEGFQRFRATENCQMATCVFADQKTTHFHCRRSGCSFTFKNKSDMGEYHYSILNYIKLFQAEWIIWWIWMNHFKPNYKICY